MPCNIIHKGFVESRQKDTAMIFSDFAKHYGRLESIADTRLQGQRVRQKSVLQVKPRSTFLEFHIAT